MRRLLVALAALLLPAPALAQGWPVSDDDRLVQQGRMLLAREYPEVMRHVARNDGFGGPSSPPIARAMLSDAPALVAEARAKMTVEPQGPGLWLLRFPYVNVALIETRRGLVVFDTGYASIGPVLAEVIPTLSRKPVTHIVVSHVHVDHAFGWAALKARWPRAQTVTSRLFPQIAAREVRLGGSIGRYNNQDLSAQPTGIERYPRPDVLVDAEAVLRIDGERFVFHHAPGETEEQLWLHLPERGAVVTADYYQGFLPNAGNGKRIMRHVDEWAAALRAMAATGATRLLPMHNRPVSGAAEVAHALTVPAEALEYISGTTVARLNAGERKDAIAASIDLPSTLAAAPELDRQYNRPEDIARMVMLRSTGWWDDIPSHFAALRFEAEAREALRLAGGLDAVDRRARELLPTDPRLAARLADWAYFGAPDDPKALRLTIDVYMARLAEKDMPVQEGLIYFDQAARARARLRTLEESTQMKASGQH